MKPFETLDSVSTPDGRKLTLHRRDHEVAIYLDGDELMANRAPDSEKALATLGLDELSDPETPRVLIGGLGLGYTLRAALGVLPPGAELVVAEFFACVEAWGRGHLADLHAGTLDDPRVRIVIDDVNRVIQSERPWDAILLDVDNGPDAWCLAGNGRLYDRPGLESIRSALAPGGLLAVWSAHHDARFVKLLKKGGFDVTTETVRAYAGKGARHTIFLARVRRPGRRREASPWGRR